MARGRMIANTVATDKRFNSLTPEAALVYLMAIPHLDRDGLILGDAMPLWGKVCPRRNEFMGHMADIISEWVAMGLVVAYECDEGTILHFTGFRQNQTGIHYDREAASQYPPPPDYIRTSKGLEKVDAEQVPTNSGVNPDEVPTNSESSPAESKVNQSKSKQSDDDDFATSTATDDAIGLVKLIQADGFVYLDNSPTALATQLIERFGWARCTDALNRLRVAHQKQISNGRRGITAPLAYLRSILDEDKAKVDTSNGDFEPNAWQILLNQEKPDYMRDED